MTGHIFWQDRPIPFRTGEMVSSALIRAGVIQMGSAPTGQPRAQVAEDVAEQVVGHDDVETPRISDHFHCHHVNIEMAGLDVGVLARDLAEGALPEIVREAHGVGLVAHAHALLAVALAVLAIGLDAQNVVGCTRQGLVTTCEEA